MPDAPVHPTPPPPTSPNTDVPTLTLTLPTIDANGSMTPSTTYLPLQPFLAMLMADATNPVMTPAETSLQATGLALLETSSKKHWRHLPSHTSSRAKKLYNLPKSTAIATYATAPIDCPPSHALHYLLSINLPNRFQSHCKSSPDCIRAQYPVTDRTSHVVLTVKLPYPMYNRTFASVVSWYKTTTGYLYVYTSLKCNLKYPAGTAPARMGRSSGVIEIVETKEGCVITSVNSIDLKLKIPKALLGRHFGAFLDAICDVAEWFNEDEKVDTVGEKEFVREVKRGKMRYTDAQKTALLTGLKFAGFFKDQQPSTATTQPVRNIISTDPFVTQEVVVLGQHIWGRSCTTVSSSALNVFAWVWLFWSRRRWGDCCLERKVLSKEGPVVEGFIRKAVRGTNGRVVEESVFR